MKKMIGIALLLLHSAAFAQTSQKPPYSLSYTFAELRYLDLDNNGGDGFRIRGSYDFGNNWILVGGLTTLDFNGNVDSDSFEIGGGYLLDLSPHFDLVSTARFVKTDTDTPGGSSDDSGLALSSGVRGLLNPNIELRGTVNYVNVSDSDTFIEVAADYHFTRNIAAGLSLEFAGDSDLISIGARWFFR